MKHSIFNWTFEHEPVKLEDTFKGVRDNDGEVIYESKQTYEHRDEGLNFDYKYVIRAENAYELTGDSDAENKWYLELMLVPTIGSLLPNQQEELKARCGEDYEPDMTDLVDDGSYVQMGFEEVFVDPAQGFDAIMPQKIAEVASVVESINSMRGFYLDRAYNRIGSTGWDILNNLVGDGKSFITAALDRYKEEQK